MNREGRRHPARRVVAAVAGVGAVTSSFSGTLVALAPSAEAAPAVGQDVNNDWGQTVAEVTEEVNLVVDADPRVITARTRYLHALSSYASIKQVQKVATTAHRSALRTATKVDDVRTARSLSLVTQKVMTAAREVVVSQLAMATLVTSVTAAVRSLHYVQAPFVAIPGQPTGLATVGASGQVSVSWPAVGGAAGYIVYRDGLQVASTIIPSYLDTGLDNGIAHAYSVVATNIAGWSPRSAPVNGTPNVVAPGAPTSLVSAPGDGQVTLAWAATPSATSYQVFRGGVLVGSPATTSYIDTGLTNGTAYSYTVKALNGAAASVASSAVASTPVATAPAAPTNLVATPGNATVGLTWTAPMGATSYRLYRDGVQIATPSTPSYSDAGVSNGSTYSYYVVAVRQNSPGSPASATVSAKPVAPPLSTPGGLSATPGNAKITLTWGAVTGATSYEVYRGGALLTTTATPTWVDSTVSNGTTYTYYVKAIGPSSTSGNSAGVTATPAAPAAGAPTGLSGVAGDKSAGLTWTPVPGATSYKVYRNGTLVGTPISPSFADTGLVNGTAYSYYVTAVVSGVDSLPSSTVQVTPFVLTPAAPTGLVATPGNAQVSLSWTAAANTTGYLVYRGAVLVSTQAGTTFTDLSLTNGTAYTYTVVATNGSVSSPASAAVSATPVAPPPAAPTGLVATAGNAQVSLSWAASPSATSYKVYRNGVLVGSPTLTTFLNTGLTNGTPYTYYVTAVTATTEGAASLSVVATPAKPPVNGTFTGAITQIASGHGTIRVVIVITNSVITSATGTLLTNDGTETVSINKTALPQYNTKAVAANSSAITKVSGATLTWPAYKTSLQSALTLAGL